jgi:amidase
LARLESAGAVLLGKLNLTEGAMAGYHPDFKVPRNPWAANRTPGFSSSGSGVASAAGMAYGTIGSDTGGSIRGPSAANGIVGLKPTYGRVSRYGVLPLAPSLDHVGPMTRRVVDAAAMLSVMTGEDTNDPTTISGAPPDFLKDLNKGIKGLRLGFDDAYATEGTPSYMADSVRQAVREMEKLGARVIPVKLPPMDESVLGAWLVLTAVEAAVSHERTYPSRADDYGIYFRSLLEKGTRTAGTNYARTSRIRSEFNGRLGRVFQQIDLLACPTTIAEAPVYDPQRAYGGDDPVAQTAAGVPLAWLIGGARFTSLDRTRRLQFNLK